MVVKYGGLPQYLHYFGTNCMRIQVVTLGNDNQQENCSEWQKKRE